MVRPYQLALEQTPESLNGVRVNVAANVFANGVYHYRVVVRLAQMPVA